MPCISHYPRCCAHSAMNQVYKKVPQKGTFWHPPGVVSLQKGELAWLPAKLISLRARLTETRRRFAGSGSLIMLLRWRLLYGCAIIVPSLRRLPRALFLLAWRGLPRFQRGSPFRPWLMRILYRHALDAMEKQRTYLRPLSLDSALESQVPLDSDSHMEQADLQEQVAQREEVQQALAQLHAEQRRVIALRYGADLTEIDIAQVLGWPVGTVKSRLNRARERLRILLNDGER